MAHLKIDSEKGLIETEGSVKEVAALLMVTINQIYSTLARTDAPAARGFQMAVRVGVLGPDSPLWKIRNEPGSISIVIPVSTKGGAKDGSTDI